VVLRDTPKIFPDSPAARNGTRRVLVVEDHEDTRLMIRTLLEMQQFEVDEAGDADAAYEMAISRKPDLILMDSTLPLGDGVTLTEQIRRHKVIALTAGSNDYLVKPIDLDRMVQVMEHWLCDSEAVVKGAKA
jgi:DNA-binding response OmpR family regulator